jgi:ABC-type nitrate/sulfonate/bicarbonate transport system permease component
MATTDTLSITIPALPATSRFRLSPGGGRPWRKVALGIGPVIVVLALWELVTRLGASPFFPPPTAIIANAYELWFTGPAWALFTTDLVWRDVMPSFGKALLGWLLASLLGIVIGSIAGYWPRAAAFLDPVVDFIRSLPKPALVPIFLIILGGGDVMRVAFIVIGCAPPVLLNAMQSVRAIDTTFKETTKAYHIGGWRTYFRVILPAASPGIAAGMRISLSLALILMVVSEWMLVNSGLGFFLLNAQRFFELTDVWSAMLLLGIGGYVLNVVFVATEKRVLRWHRATTMN